MARKKSKKRGFPFFYTIYWTLVIAALAGGQLWLQIVLFFGVSGVSLALLRPISKKHFNTKQHKGPGAESAYRH